MPFLAAPELSVSVATAQSFFRAARVRAISEFFDADVTRSTIEDLRVGAIAYPLRRPLRAIFIPGRGELLVDGFSPMFVGHGSTEEAALLDWRDSVHWRFQELVNKRPFEMDEAERRTWNTLSEHIDVTVYRNQVPIQVTQFGFVSKARPIPSEITWEDGTRDAIRLDTVASPNFVTFKAGQPLEAVVARDPITFELLSILHVERRKQPSRLKREDEAALLQDSSSANRLEEVGWE